jgi:hypothetical protein
MRPSRHVGRMQPLRGARHTISLPPRPISIYRAHAMPTSLHSALDSLASAFANSVLDAIRAASLDDLLAESGGAPRRGPGRPRGAETRAGNPQTKTTKGGRLARRSPEEIAKAVDLVTKLLKTHPKGLRSEEIRKAFGLDAREMPRVLKEGLSKKKLKSKGRKRATTYTAA